MGGNLGDAVRHEIDRVETGHLLRLQEIDGMALPLGEQRDQYIGAGDFLAAGGLDMDRRALEYALKAGGGLGIVRAGDRQVGQLGIDIVGNVLAELCDVDAAGAHDGDGILVFGQREKEMLERCIFVPAGIGLSKGLTERLLEISREHGCLSLSPGYIEEDVGVGGQSP